MSLPFASPLAPMLSKPLAELPHADGLRYEPKWDGFRCIVFRDGDDIELSSRNERPLNRYFPELLAPLAAALPPRCVLDGEVVIAGPAGLDFDALLQRIHPAASRVALLAASSPASFVAFDLLALGDEDLRPSGFARRRALLEEAVGRNVTGVELTPTTEDPEVAADWFARFEGAGLDGVMVKSADAPYLAGERTMGKVKHERTADCVVGGFRFYKGEQSVGSLLLGLYDKAGTLHHVGVASSFSARRRVELLSELEPLRPGASEASPWAGAAPAEQRRPGTPSRWSSKSSLDFELLRPELVCEVAYDQLQGPRFRHGTRFRRWRTDREPASCRYDQLEVVVPAELAELFARR